MATCTATKTGNWSDPTVWDSTPNLPGAGDTAECSSYIVTIDQNITVTQIQSSSSGYFAVTAARTISANILSNTGHSGGGVVRCSHSTGTVSITGMVTAGPSIGVTLSGAGTLNVTGNVTGGSATNAYGLQQTAGALIINGDITGGSGSTSLGLRVTAATSTSITGTCTGGSGGSADAVRLVSGSSTITITGNVAGGTNSGCGVNNQSIGTITVSGTATGGSNSAVSHGAFNASTGTVTVAGACIGGSFAGACGLYGSNSNGTTTFKVVHIGGTLGSAVGGHVKLAVDATVNYIRTKRSDTGADYDLSNDYPAIANVTSGTTYKLGTLTGTYSGSGGLLTHPGMAGGARG